MNDGKLTVMINGREALPVRAIPYVASLRFPVDVLINCLAQNDKGGHSKLLPLTAYRVGHQVLVPITPREWQITKIKLKGFEAKLDLLNDNHDIGNSAWYTKAVNRIPAGVFVWLDDFRDKYLADKERVSFSQAKPEEDRYILAPMLNDDIRAMVIEGFELNASDLNQNQKFALTINHLAEFRAAQSIFSQETQDAAVKSATAALASKNTELRNEIKKLKKK